MIKLYLEITFKMCRIVLLFLLIWIRKIPTFDFESGTYKSITKLYLFMPSITIKCLLKPS